METVAPPSASPPVPRTTPRSSTLFILGLLTLMLLSVQFVLGMALNLYTPIPAPRWGMMGAMGSPGMGLLMAHMMTGGLLLLLSLLLGIVATLSGQTLPTLLGWGTLGSILLSSSGGVLFLMGGQTPETSFAMAVGFLLAMLCVVGLLLVYRTGSVRDAHVHRAGFGAPSAK